MQRVNFHNRNTYFFTYSLDFFLLIRLFDYMHLNIVIAAVSSELLSCFNSSNLLVCFDALLSNWTSLKGDHELTTSVVEQQIFVMCCVKPPQPNCLIDALQTLHLSRAASGRNKVWRSVGGGFPALTRVIDMMLFTVKTGGIEFRATPCRGWMHR